MKPLDPEHIYGIYDLYEKGHLTIKIVDNKLNIIWHSNGYYPMWKITIDGTTDSGWDMIWKI